MFAHFKEYHEIVKNFKSLYDFGGRCLNIRARSFGIFRNKKSSQTNAYSHYSNYSYSGLIPNERTLRDVCMDFEPYFKVHNLVSVHPKGIMLSQMINLNMIFHVMVSVYRLVKIWNSPQLPVEFRNGLT